MDKKFTVGQKVKCVDAGDTTLRNGVVYTVERVCADGDVFLKETKHPATGWFVARRFEPVERQQPKFKVGDKVRNLHDGSEEWGSYRGARRGDVCTVIKIEPSNVWTGEQLIRLAEYENGSPQHLRRASKYELVEEPKFKAGDLVTPNDQEHDTRSFTKGKPYMVREYRPAQEDACGVLYFESDDQGYKGRFRPESFYERYVEPEASEPATEFRIRKHGGTLGDIRGTRYSSKEEARKAATRYVAGAYEVVRVVVEDVIKVEHITRVIDYKEAA